MKNLKLIKLNDRRIGWRCQLCEEVIRLPALPELHHIIRRGATGTELYDLINVLPLTAILCSECNHTDADCIPQRNELLCLNKKLYGQKFIEALKNLYQASPALTLLQVQEYKELINDEDTSND